MQTLNLKTNDGVIKFSKYCHKHESLIGEIYTYTVFYAKTKLTKYQYNRLKRSLKNNELEIVSDNYIDNYIDMKEYCIASMEQ